MIDKTADSARIEALQSGQLDWVTSHLSTQSQWKQCWHCGKTFSLSPSSNTPRHIQHSLSTAVPLLLVPKFDLCKVIGKALMIVDSRPLGGRRGAWCTGSLEGRLCREFSRQTQRA
jgi:hypothetical protein